MRTGVGNILAEMMAETALIRAAVRSVLWETGRVCASKHDKLQEGQGQEYKDYFAFSESARQIPPHRILALNRGEKEHAIKVRLEWNTEAVKDTALKALSEKLLHDAGRMPAPPSPPPGPPGAGSGAAPGAATPPLEAPPTEAPPTAMPPTEVPPTEVMFGASAGAKIKLPE